MVYKKNIRNIFLKQKAILRKKRRSRIKKRNRNIIKNSQKSFTQHSISRDRGYYNKVENVVIKADPIFSLFEKPENVIRVVSELDKHKQHLDFLRRIKIDLSKITMIDIGAITFLLAKINEMRSFQRIYIYGNMPDDQTCRKIFEDSGFLDYVRSVSGQQFEKHSDNFIVSIGEDLTKNERVGKSIKDTIKYLTGNSNHYPPVFSIVQEMCSNSVEHANDDRHLKNWFFGICFEGSHHDNSLKVVFTMTDIGYGILKTIKRKFGTKISELLSGANDTQILRRAFEKQYQSQTEEINRNRGLPFILDRFDRGYIKNLKVMTNNVFLDFNDSGSSRLINKNIPGTFYYWTLDFNCLETWNQTSIA